MVYTYSKTMIIRTERVKTGEKRRVLAFLAIHYTSSNPCATNTVNLFRIAAPPFLFLPFPYCLFQGLFLFFTVFFGVNSNHLFHCFNFNIPPCFHFLVSCCQLRFSDTDASFHRDKRYSMFHYSICSNRIWGLMQTTTSVLL